MAPLLSFQLIDSEICGSRWAVLAFFVVWQRRAEFSTLAHFSYFRSLKRHEQHLGQFFLVCCLISMTLVHIGFYSDFFIFKLKAQSVPGQECEIDKASFRGFTVKINSVWHLSSSIWKQLCNADVQLHLWLSKLADWLPALSAIGLCSWVDMEGR